MRIPHHLVRSDSGIYHFRLKVPLALQAGLGRRVIKQSLWTKDLNHARGAAYLLALHYAHAFAALKGKPVSKPPSISDIVAGFHREGRKFEADLDPITGRPIRIKTDGSEVDGRAAENFMKSFASPTVLMPPGIPPVSLVPTRSTMTLADAVRRFEVTKKGTVAADTQDARTRALHSFVAFTKPETPVGQISRAMIAGWAYNVFTEQKVASATVGGYVSHVSQLFEMLIEAGEIEGKNPATGAWKRSKSEKLQRLKQGFAWEAFELSTLQTIFDPKNYRRLNYLHSRWAPLIGLYTGARVGEIAQLYLRDFFEVDGNKCVHFTEDSDGQGMKEQSSKRVIPLHPMLVELGLWELVEKLRQEGHDRLFPNMRINSKAGRGNAVSKTFSYYLERLSITPRRENGTIGFHSLRKSVIQTLQASMLSAERRRAFVGHERGEDVHSIHYMRPWTVEEMKGLFPGLPWGEWLDVPALRSVLWSPERGEPKTGQASKP